MNERIQELKIQACKWASENATSTEYENMADQKFAELIVRECILRCNETLVPHTGQPSMTHNYAVGLCQDKIKQHFGVQE